MNPFLYVLIAIGAFAQSPPEWSRPFEPHKVAGNVYYVGTEDLACYLITGSQGHILINSALEDSTEGLLKSVERLGFRTSDIKVLLTNQAHFDHTAGLAEVQRRTKAEMWATPPDAKLLESGDGPPTGNKTRIAGFKPVHVSRILGHGEAVKLGDISLKVHHHFGHSPGSASYEMKLPDGRTLLFANMGTVVVSLTSYPTIVEEFETTFARQKQLDPDIWVAAHRSQYAPGSKVAYSGRAEYREAVAKHEQRYRQQKQIELGK